MCMRLFALPNSVVALRVMLLAGVAAVGVAACTTSDLVIEDATLSQDQMRLRLTVQSCNAELVADVTESADDIVVVVSDAGSPFLNTGDETCQDTIIVTLAAPFASRGLIDGGSGESVSVTRPPPDTGPPWPYDRSRFTEADFVAALEAMVACIEDADPQMDAWIDQDLDWKVVRWAKPTDEPSNVEEVRVYEACLVEHVGPLE